MTIKSTLIPPDNPSIVRRGERFRLFMTSRQCTEEAPLRALEYIPRQFHKYITVVTGAEYHDIIRTKYPELATIWVTPDDINSAALKRTLIMSSYQEDHALLINDDVAVYCHCQKESRWVRPTYSQFGRHLASLMDVILSGEFGGVSLHDRMFAKQITDKARLTRDFPDAYVKRISFIGAFFWIAKAIVRSKDFHLGRLNYYEDIDYSLQLLSLGHKTAQYTGMVFSHPNTKPTRQHSDRTAQVQSRDRERLISFFPHAVRMRPAEKLRDDLNIDIYVSYSKAFARPPAVRTKGLFPRNQPEGTPSEAKPNSTHHRKAKRR